MNHSQAKAAAASVESGASTGSDSRSASMSCASERSQTGRAQNRPDQKSEIGIYNVGGSFYALHSMCPHQFGPACLVRSPANPCVMKALAGAFNGERTTKSWCAPGTGCSSIF